MPTENGRIYRLPNETPAKGISLDDIGSCLGMSARDLGTLCQGMSGYEGHTTSSQSSPLYKDIAEYRGQINNWSKAKPVWFTGANSLLPPKTANDTGLAQKWEIRYRGNLNGASLRDNTYINKGTEQQPSYAPFDTIFANEVPTGNKLYGSATDSGSFTSGTQGGIGLSTNPSADDLDRIHSLGGWIVDLMMDGNKFGSTNVYTLRWRYNPPVTGSGTPFILLDFDGYDHQSANPMPSVDNYYPIRVTFTNVNDNPNDDVLSVSIPISASFPAESGRDGITFDEVEAALKARGIISTPTRVTSPSGNPFQKGYCESDGQGGYKESTDTTVQSKIYYQGKGLSDMYLCALLYHRVACNSEDLSDGVQIDCSLWLSAPVKRSAAQNAGWNKITMYLQGGQTPTISGFNLNTLKTKLLDSSGDQDWRIKLFWCSEKIENYAEPTASSYFLVRGNDSTSAGTLVTFVDANLTSSSPNVSVTSMLAITEDEYNVYYNFAVSVNNPTNDSVTFDYIDIYSYQTEGHIDPFLEEELEDIELEDASHQSGNFYPISVGVSTQKNNEPMFTGFLVYAHYGNDQDNLCGVWIPQSGEPVPFSPADPYGNTWEVVQERYSLTIPS